VSVWFHAVEEGTMKVIKAAAVQLSPVLYSRAGTIEKVVRQIRKLGQQGVQFAAQGNADTKVSAIPSSDGSSSSVSGFMRSRRER
jgi:hypothetical protein